LYRGGRDAKIRLKEGKELRRKKDAYGSECVGHLTNRKSALGPSPGVPLSFAVSEVKFGWTH